MRTIFKFFGLILILFLLVSETVAISVSDSLVFSNGNIIVGEIKSMDRGVLQIETDYSDSDFKIEWEKITEIYTETFFLVTLTDGRKYYGNIRSISSIEAQIITVDGFSTECELQNIVFLSPIKKTFLDRLYASIDLSYSVTKAENLKQATSRSTIGYRAEKWSADIQYNTFLSKQSQVEPIERSDGKIDYRYIFPGRWYAIATISVESNSEIKLDQRINGRLGFGRFFIRTNAAYWGTKLGVNRNIERFTNETPDRQSWEGFLGSELNLYDIGDFSLLTTIMLYPGLTDKERLRGDFNLDTKYDLPYDFYIRLSFTMNYDNKPAEGASEVDYVFLTGFGWEW